MQPRTSLSKFGGKFNSLFIRLLTPGPPAGPDRGRPVPLLGDEQAAGVRPHPDHLARFDLRWHQRLVYRPKRLIAYLVPSNTFLMN